MSRGVSIILTLVIIIAILSLGILYYRNFYRPPASEEILPRFRSIEEVRDYISTHAQSGFFYGIAEYGRAAPLAATHMEKAGAGEETPEYSLTNVQVEGIDEADYVKTDGRYIYLIKNNILYIVHAYPPTELNIVNEIRVANATISGIYIHDSKIVLITHTAYYKILPLKTITEEDEGPGVKVRKLLSSILVYDVTDPFNPILVKNVSFAGEIRDTRLMNGVLYSIVYEYSVKYNITLPEYYIDGVKYSIDPSEIYYSPDAKDYGFQYVIIFTLNLDNFQHNVFTMLTGYTNILYMSYKNIYLTQTTWRPFILYEEIEKNRITTKIYKFKINILPDGGAEISPYAVGEVPGYINNRLQLDEYKGFLRVSTYNWVVITTNPFVSKSYTSIFILDEDMEIVGSLTGLGESEHLYATRFMGDYAYLVTYRRVDPLFVIDLSNPEDPKVAGELKIPGFSSMLQPIWNNLIIGIGYETDNETRIIGLKISLFDVSDPKNPVEIGKIVFSEGGWGWSEAAHDIHAILKVPKLEYVGIPVELYGVKGKTAYLVVKANETGLYKEGLIELHKVNDNAQFYPWYYYMRGLYIGDYLYIVTGNQVEVYTLSTLEYINHIILKP